MIKIHYNYLPTKQVVIKEYIKNSIKNTVIIDCLTNDVFINGFKHTQKYYPSNDINEYAYMIMNRINERKIKNI